MKKRAPLKPLIVLSTFFLGLHDARVDPAPAAPLVAYAEAKDVPFVPTGQRSVNEMLDLAGVTKEDVVYDLGSGDGRIVITASRDRGARGVGIDIDPERINEGRENAESVGVSDRVKFVQADLFEADIKEATVVTMYLLQAVNLRLRPRLLAELRPGTRLVSHAFHMGNWKPEQVKRVGGDRLYLWTVPARVQGNWDMAVRIGKQEAPGVLRLTQIFQEVRGTLSLNGSEAVVREAAVQGDRIRFQAEPMVDGAVIALRFDGRVAGEAMSGQTIASKSGTEIGRFTAQKREEALAF